MRSSAGSTFCSLEVIVGRHGEGEELHPFDVLVSEFHHFSSGSCSGDGPLENRIYDWIYVLVYILEEEGKAILDGKLQLLQEIRVVERPHTAFELLTLLFLDPVDGLRSDKGSY